MRPPMQGAFSRETALTDFILPHALPGALDGRDRKLFDSTAPGRPTSRRIVHPCHDNKLIASLELDRLRNYLTVIEWQDRQAA